MSIRDLKKTPVFDVYWYFAVKRQEVFFNRLEGKESLWTNDPIIQKYKFTNVYRASDRVSQYLIRNVIYSDNNFSPEAKRLSCHEEESLEQQQAHKTLYSLFPSSSK